MDGLRSLSGDRAGVTPVIGVLIMVVVTVTLAGVVQLYLFSYADDKQIDPPQSGFTIEADAGVCEDGGLVVTHTGGQSIAADRLYVRSPELSVSGPWSDPSGYATTGAGDGTVETGDSATVCADDLSGATVRVLWLTGTGEESVLLAEWSGDRR
jgi:flagellin-like protein